MRKDFIKWSTCIFVVLFLFGTSTFGQEVENVTVSTGWNFISMSRQPADTDISSVLESIAGKYVSVWAYINGSWKVYDPASPSFSDLTTIEAGRGYWINMTESAILTVSGSDPSASISLTNGWNLVGYNSSTSQGVANALASIASKYVSVWTYVNGTWKVYDPNNPGFSDLTTMDPGYGYWINATEACTWTLPYSISGTAMKGVIKDATVSIYDLNSDGTKGDLLETTTTDSNGEYLLSFVIESSNGCYMVEISEGVYTDEIIGEDITMGASDVLRVVECGLSSGESYVLAVTPLTSIAAARATTLAAAGGTLTTTVATSNLGVAQQYGIDSILTTIPVDPTSTAATELATRSQRNYGVVLAGMTRLADTNDVRAIDFAAALADDIVDGIMDGEGASGGITINRISTGTYILDRDDGVGNLQNEIDNFLAGPNNQANVNNVKIGPAAVNVGLNTAGRVYVTTTVLPAWIEGQNGSVTLTATGGTPPNVWDVPPGSALPPGFNLAANGIFSGTAPLLAAGSTMSISPPFTVRVTDTNQNSSTLVLYLTVIKAPPTITINTCSNATVGQYYTCNVAAATGGVPPYYYVLNSGGAFPPFGLTLGTDGTVTGTPTVVGSRTFSVCVVDYAGAQDCADAFINVVAPLLEVGKAGDGSGTVTSSPAGINCEADCSETYDIDTVVTLTASPDSSSTFTGWSGACSGTGSCVLTMDEDKAVTATFTKIYEGGHLTAIESLSCVLGEVDPDDPYIRHAILTVSGTASTSSEANLYIYSNPAQAYYSSTSSADCGSWTGTFNCMRGSEDPVSTTWSIQRDFMLSVDNPESWPQEFIAKLSDIPGMTLATDSQPYTCQ